MVLHFDVEGGNVKKRDVGASSFQGAEDGTAIKRVQLTPRDSGKG